MLTRIRRAVLKHLIPEFVWPKEISLDGINFKLRGTPYSFGIKYFLSRTPENYELPERIFLKYINQGDCVLELGSSIGIITQFIINKVGPTGYVMAVEASTKLTSYSATWLEKSPHIKVINGFGFPVHQAIPFSFRFDDTRGSLGGQIIFEAEEVSKVSERAFFIENAEKEFDLYPNVLVCDIEGSEIVLLQEKAALPGYLKTIIMELHPGVYTINNALKLIERIQEFGFALQASINSVYVFTRI